MAKIELDLKQVEEAVERSSPAVPYPRTWLSDRLEAVVDAFGRFFSWSWILLMLLVVSNVFLRYLFNSSLVALEELQWHIYAVGFMVGLSYCVIKDGHVRVDVVAERFSIKTRAWIDLLGMSLMLIPFCLFILYFAYPYVERAYLIGEVSGSPGGLPMRWLIKSVILLGIGLLLLASLAQAIRALSLISGFPKPLDDSSNEH